MAGCGDHRWMGRAAVVFAGSVMLARRRPVPDLDRRLLMAVNRLPDAIYGLVWPVMQAGSLAAVPVSAVVAGRLGNRRLAWGLAGAGLTAWLAGKAAKPMADRDRPAAYVDDVVVRGAPQTGRGFPSGHAAVSTALAMMLGHRATPAVRAAAAATATAVTGSRIYVGAHFPLDAVGGVALGVMVGSAVRVVADCWSLSRVATTARIASRSVTE